MKAAQNSVISKENAKNLYSSKTTQKILINITYVCLGAVISNGSIFTGFAPFGCAYLASIPYQSVFWGGLGCVLGAFIMPGVFAYRYIACAIAVMAFRWVLSEIDTLSKRKIFAPIIAFIPLLASGIIM